MRTTLSLDDDVAVMLAKLRKSKDASFKEIVNQALREGLTKLSEPAPKRKPFRTTPHNCGECYFPNLDKTWDVIAAVEGEWYK